MDGSDNNLDLNLTGSFLLRGSKDWKFYSKIYMENSEFWSITRTNKNSTLHRCLNAFHLQKFLKRLVRANMFLKSMKNDNYEMYKAWYTIRIQHSILSTLACILKECTSMYSILFFWGQTIRHLKKGSFLHCRNDWCSLLWDLSSLKQG